METPESRTGYSAIHPLHAVLLAGTVPLFLGALFSDLAYFQTYQIQWKNFASWLIPGGLVFAGLALLWTVIELLRADLRGRRPYTYFLVLLGAWILGFINALVHAKDAWASMPLALVLSILVAALVIAATALGFSTLGTRGIK
ncbi:MAG: hypothetical protein EOP60_09480 [Sphingomonadales bacterium]|nr:MAG: hypothetical protein EOP60_09480 [Sphingomonadales bacterium]